MRLSSKVQALLERLQREGCSAELVSAAEQILADTEVLETRLLEVAQDNIELTDTLQSDRSLHQAELRFERDCQQRKDSE